MARESAGAVYVTIDADSGPLIAKYAQAAAASQAAGQQIAKGLASGLQSGVSPILNAAGQAQAAVTQIAAAAVKAAPQIAQVTQAVTGVTAATNIATPAVARTAAAVSGLGAASSHSVSEIQAVSGAIRTFDGNGGIRAAERFIVTTLGLGPALQAIFPLVGALALSELLVNVGEKVFKLADNFLFLRDAEEEAKRVGEETADALEKSADHMRDLVVEVLREKGQLVLAAQESQFDLGQKFIHPPKLDESKLSGLASEDIDKVKSAFANVLPADLGDRIRQVNHDLADMSELWVQAGKSADPLSQHFRSQAQVGVQLLGDALQFLKTKQDEFDAEQVAAQAKVGKAQEEENKKRLEASKRFAADQRSAFKDGWENLLADQRAAHDVSKQEELTFRQNELAAALAGGPALAPVATEVKRQVGTLSQEVRKEDSTGSSALALSQVEYASRLRKEAISELEADGRLMGAAVEKITKEQDAAAAARKSAADIADRAGKQARQYLDVSASGSGEADKLRLQIAYEAQVVHTKQQQIDYAVRLGEIESATAQEKLRAADADVQDAQAALALNPSAVQLLQLQQAITAQKKAQSDLDNQGLKNQVRLQPLQRGLGSQLGDDAKQIGPAVSGALATGIMNGGKGLGQDIRNALSGIGRKMLDDVFTKLIEQLGINAAIDAITNSIGATHITAQAAQTAATVANTAALVASTTTQGAGAAAGAGGAVAAAAGTAATGAVSSIIGPVIGGVISGVISAAATFIGDAAIVKAIHGTTAAVMSLRVSGVGQTSKGTNQQTGSQIESSSTGILSSIGAGLFQAITGAGALPVRIVAISPLAPLAGLFGLLGFAGGGRPPVGVPSIVGERGPELFIPDSPGVIIPNVPGTGGGTSSHMLTASMVSNSSSNAMSIGAIHLHGVQNVEQFARRLPSVLKSRAPVFSPATR